MKILITNHHLNLLGGSETFTYTLAHALRRAGHEVCIITAEKGTVSQVLEKEGFEITDVPTEWRGRKFDVIHAHHNGMAMVARHVFPLTPMLFLSHGIIPGLEEPPSIDLGIARYIGVSEEVVSALSEKHGIADAAIMRNGVDCNRFKPAQSIAERPEKVLILSNHCEKERLSLVTKACAVTGAEVQLAGMENGSIWRTEEAINDADIVISLGRGAVEAMACGRAAFVYDWHGGDGMITPENYAEIRKHNFSGRRFKTEYTAETLAEELSSYDPEMGRKNREIALEYHNIDSQVPFYEELYSETIEAGVSGNMADPPGREILFYQAAWRERSAIWSHALELNAENQKLKAEIAAIKPRLQSLMQQYQAEKSQLEAERKKLGGEEDISFPTLPQRIYRRSTHLPKENSYRGENLVFIVGPPRSGTTWVLSLLKEHPDIKHATMKNLRLPQSGQKTLETGIFLEGGGVADEEIRSRFYDLSKENPGKVIVEKTPFHLFATPRITSIFPEAAVILTCRDGRDVATSMVHVAKDKSSWWQGAPGDIRSAADYWRQFAVAGLEFERHYQPLVIRYEELLKYTYAELACLLKALGLSLDSIDCQIEASQAGKNIPIKGVFREGKKGGWRDLFTESDVKTFKSVAGDTLIALGYEQDNNW